MSFDQSVIGRQRSESFLVAALLAASGGLLDAYTYLCRGGVFANAQTGNIVLVGIGAAAGDFSGAMSALIPIVAFAIGVLLTEVIHFRFTGSEASAFHWRQLVLVIEIVMLIIAGLIPQGMFDHVVTTIISAVCAMQVQSFRKVRGHGFASTMCTGNLRSGTEALVIFIRTGDKEHLSKSLCYYGIILIFVAGAFVGALVSNDEKSLAIPISVMLTAAAFILMTRWDRLSKPL